MIRRLFMTNAWRQLKNPNPQLRQFSRCPLNQQIPPTLLPTATKSIAYEKLCPESPKSPKSPCVIFIPGFMSGKDGDKAKFLREHCHDKYSYVRYDPSGIGDSPGDLGSVRFSDWVDNASSVLEQVGEEENVLVGSSLGAWISVLVAMKDRGRGKIKGLVLIAPALNVLRPYYELVMPKLDSEALEVFNKGEVYTLNDEEFGEFNMWKALVERIEDFEIDVDGEIPVKCPVRILHGCEDRTIPFSASIDVMKCLESKDVEVTLKKSAEHEFKDPGSLQLLAETLDKLITEIQK